MKQLYIKHLFLFFYINLPTFTDEEPKIIMNKKPGRVLLICIIVLAIICPLHIYHDKKKVEDIKSGAIVIQNSETPIDELHPEFAYLWLFPYGIVEVVLLSLYYVRTRD